MPSLSKRGRSRADGKYCSICDKQFSTTGYYLNHCLNDRFHRIRRLAADSQSRGDEDNTVLSRFTSSEDFGESEELPFESGTSPISSPTSMLSGRVSPTPSHSDQSSPSPSPPQQFRPFNHPQPQERNVATTHTLSALEQAILPITPHLPISKMEQAFKRIQMSEGEAAFRFSSYKEVLNHMGVTEVGLVLSNFPGCSSGTTGKCSCKSYRSGMSSGDGKRF